MYISEVLQYIIEFDKAEQITTNVIYKSFIESLKFFVVAVIVVQLETKDKLKPIVKILFWLNCLFMLAAMIVLAL